MCIPFGYIQVDFQKAIIFLIDFDDFIKLWGQLGVTLESLWDTFVQFGATLGSLWGHFGSLWGHFAVALGHFGITLGSLLVYEGDFGGT